MPTLRGARYVLNKRLGIARFRLGIIVVRRRVGLALIEDYLRDRAFHGWAGGRATNRAPGTNDFNAMHHYELRRVFEGENGVEIYPDDVLVDFGCGKGRVLSYWLSRGCRNKMVGLELNEDLAAEARSRLKDYPSVQIVGGEGLANLPPDGTLYWLFVPFRADDAGQNLMRDFKQRIEATHKPGRRLRVVLFRNRHAGVFTQDRRWQLRRLEGRPRLFYGTAVLNFAGPE
jgi:methyltransferase family protein